MILYKIYFYDTYFAQMKGLFIPSKHYYNKNKTLKKFDMTPWLTFQPNINGVTLINFSTYLT